MISREFQFRGFENSTIEIEKATSIRTHFKIKDFKGDILVDQNARNGSFLTKLDQND